MNINCGHHRTPLPCEYCADELALRNDQRRRAECFPDLLEALSGLYKEYCCVMRSEFDFPGRPWTPDRDNDTEAIKARAAIAKATGGTS